MVTTRSAQKQPPQHTGGARMTTAETFIYKADVVMARLIDTHGPCQIANRTATPFQTLATSIISQQLSAKAAATIKGRLLTTVSSFTPDGLLLVAPDRLRETGLSGPKIRYLGELSRRVMDGSLDFNSLERRNDEEVIAVLTSLPGVGRWTAEMFLIFGLKRPDVLSVGDAGLKRSARLLYGDAAELETIGQAWRPYASTASWYLWRHLDDH